MPVESSLLLSLVRRYFLELAFSTTGHDGSPWIRLMRNEALSPRNKGNSTQILRSRQYTLTLNPGSERVPREIAFIF